MNLQTAAVGLCSVFFLRQEASGLEWALKRLAVRGLSAPAHSLASEHFNMLDAQIGTLTPPMVLEQALWSGDGGPRSQGKHLFLLNKWSGSLLLSVCFDRQPHAELQIASRRVATKSSAHVFNIWIVNPNCNHKIYTGPRGSRRR